MGKRGATRSVANPCRIRILWGECKSAAASRRLLWGSGNRFRKIAVFTVQHSNLLWRASGRRLTSHAPRAWWLWTALYAPIPHQRDQSPARRRVQRQPRKKNAPCISDLAGGGECILKNGKGVFFRGSALQVFGQWRGGNAGASRRAEF